MSQILVFFFISWFTSRETQWRPISTSRTMTTLDASWRWEIDAEDLLLKSWVLWLRNDTDCPDCDPNLTYVTTPY